VIPWVFAFLHLLALGIGLGAIHTRARAGGRGLPIDRAHARTFAPISHVQTVLVIVMVLLATAMARGLFVG
jgi:hypothetical protein